MRKVITSKRVQPQYWIAKGEINLLQSYTENKRSSPTICLAWQVGLELSMAAIRSTVSQHDFIMLPEAAINANVREYISILAVIVIQPCGP